MVKGWETVHFQWWPQPFPGATMPQPSRKSPLAGTGNPGAKSEHDPPSLSNLDVFFVWGGFFFFVSLFFFLFIFFRVC